jgi:hypothetical protein|tara:strand:+ start:304 stop:504 length:201 start_codon:yes stop_codon:yes gene_type:complete
MTFYFLGYHLTFNFRNGIGLDIESCDARPIWVGSLNCFGTLNGLVVLIPFVVVTYGSIVIEGMDTN